VNDASGTWLLAIDTSSEQASIALFDGHRVADLTWPAGRDQTVSVLDEIDHLITLNKLTVADLAIVAVATGPGMFNGLRVGMSVAKGLAFSASLPLIGVPTLDAVALPLTACELPIIAVLSAGRGRLLWAKYTDGHGTEPRNGTPEELAAEIEAGESDVLLCGEIIPNHREIFAKAAHVRVTPISSVMHRASAVAELAWRRYLADDCDDPVTLEPTYLHAASPVRVP
jgi:tRNA threonylcarbamoyladenosine biosynthesis protein TsaB